ncbi:hypothetical protein Nmel_007456 [Mimus melanotis]
MIQLKKENNKRNTARSSKTTNTCCQLHEREAVEQVDWKTGNNYYWLENTWTKKGCLIK